MRKVYAKCGSVIPLGRLGENEATAVIFDVAEWVEAYGSGNFAVLVQRNGDVNPYPCAVSHVGGVVTWEVSSADVSAVGYGKAELVYYVGEVVAKSAIYTTVVGNALTGSTEPPEPYEDWVQRITAAGTEALASAELAEQKAVEAGQSAASSESFAVVANASAAAANIAANRADSAQTAAEAAKTAAEDAATNASNDMNTAKNAAQLAQRAQTNAENAAAEITGLTAEANTLAPSAEATASYDSRTGKLTFGIPRGADGEPGKTPIKGTDYFTPAEVNDIASKAAQKVPAPDLSSYAKNADLTAEVTRATNAERQLSEGLNQLNEDIVDKLDKPTDAPSVGKILKVKSVNADGTFTVEWADTPTPDLTDYLKNTDYANEAKGGAIKASQTYNFNMSTSGVLRGYVNTLNQYGSRSDQAVIAKGTLENIKSDVVKRALTDTTQADWTADEQAAARARMGASGGKFELIEEFTLPEDVPYISKSAEPNGKPYNFERIKILLETPIATARTLYLNINGGTNIVDNIARFNNFYNNTFTGLGAFDCDVSHGLAEGRVLFSYGSKANNSTPYIGSHGWGNRIADAISALYLAAYDSTIVAGTSIRIYAVRK